MSIEELINAAQPLEIDQRRRVLLDLEVWEQIVSLLEDLEDAEEMRRALQEEDDLVPWEDVKANYWAAHPDV